MSNVDKYELIELYIKGELTNSEVKEVENLIKSDPAFANEVKNQQKLFEIISDGALIDVKNKLNNLHQNYVSGKGIHFNRNWGIISLSTFVIVAATVVLLYLNREKEQNNNKQVITESVIDTIIKKKNHQLKILNKQSAIVPGSKNNELIKHSSSLKTNIGTENTEEPQSVYPPIEMNDVVPSQVTEIKITETEASFVTAKDIHEDEKIDSDKKKEKDVEESSAKEVDCNKVKISANVETNRSCNNKPTGKITILSGSINGGTAPYKFSVNSRNNFKLKNVFPGLYAGSYYLYAQDYNNCISEIGYFNIEEEDCEIEYVFAPLLGEVWEIPVKNRSGKINIFSKAGKIVYFLDFKSFDKAEWDGKDLNGYGLPMGIYRFNIEYENGETKTGFVTIVK